MTIFSKIIAGEIPSNKVYEDDQILAFRDIAPVAETHILIIPKEEIASLDTAKPEHAAILGKIQLVAAEIARKEGIAEDGYRLVLNNGKNGGQTVDHIHYHLIGGRMLGWPPFTDIAKK